MPDGAGMWCGRLARATIFKAEGLNAQNHELGRAKKRSPLTEKPAESNLLISTIRA